MSSLTIGSASHFWTNLFQENIAARLDQVCTDQVPATYHLVDYGDVQVTTKRASTNRDGFMSDAYLLSATTADKSFTTFVKVGDNWGDLRRLSLRHFCSGDAQESVHEGIGRFPAAVQP
jgi:hypothetical protein